jgi:hypothetical protein
MPDAVDLLARLSDHPPGPPRPMADIRERARRRRRRRRTLVLGAPIVAAVCIGAAVAANRPDDRARLTTVPSSSVPGPPVDGGEDESGAIDTVLIPSVVVRDGLGVTVDDGATLTLEAEGFPPGDEIRIAQCRLRADDHPPGIPEVDPSQCDEVHPTTARADSRGMLTARVQVFRDIGLTRDGTVRQEPCRPCSLWLTGRTSGTAVLALPMTPADDPGQ